MAGHYASTGWSDLPIDLLIHVLRLLELPEALAFRAVCPLWRSAYTAAAGIPFPRTRRTPWLVSLVTGSHWGGKQSPKPWDPSISSKFCNLLDEKTYEVSFPGGKAVALCGASHGWLVMANELSNLVLYDPFAMKTILLPPITSFSKCIEGVYGEDGNLEGYRYLFYRGGDSIYDMVSPGKYFYDKVVLSGSPSAGGAIALVIHTDGKRLSFARVGGSSWWQLLSSVGCDDSFADIVHHRGKFYALTMKGILLSLDFCCGLHKPERETIIAESDNLSGVITRYLVSTPWGHLLQVRVILLDRYQKKCFRIEIDKINLKSHKPVALNPTEALQGHTVFLGQNSPGVLSTDEFPELRPDCIYFTTPRLQNYRTYVRRMNRWSSVFVYDLREQTLESAFPLRPKGENYDGRRTYPLEVWFTPSLSPYRTFSVSLASLYN